MKYEKHIYSNKFLLGEGEGEGEKPHFYSNCGKIIPLQEVLETNLAEEVVQCNECRLAKIKD